jgi:diguanylate cyclase (GGDEF)-like protein
VNDAHGHLAGDEALKMVAVALRGAIRREDVLGRYGGDEFAVVARDTALEGAFALGERIRTAVARSRWVWQGQELAVTVSVGIAGLPGGEHLARKNSGRELVHAADRALYRAKRRGRNLVVGSPVGSPPATPPPRAERVREHGAKPRRRGQKRGAPAQKRSRERAGARRKPR